MYAKFICKSICNMKSRNIKAIPSCRNRCITNVTAAYRENFSKFFEYTRKPIGKATCTDSDIK